MGVVKECSIRESAECSNDVSGVVQSVVSSVVPNLDPSDILCLECPS